jgi:hypothetical protein
MCSMLLRWFGLITVALKNEDLRTLMPYALYLSLDDSGYYFAVHLISADLIPAESSVF